MWQKYIHSDLAYEQQQQNGDMVEKNQPIRKATCERKRALKRYGLGSESQVWVLPLIKYVPNKGLYTCLSYYFFFSVDGGTISYYKILCEDPMKLYLHTYI